MCSSDLLARSQLETGRVAAAEEILDRLLAWKDLENVGALYWACLYDRGRAHLKNGRLGPAIDHLRRAIDAIERVRSTIPFEAGKIGFLADKQAVNRALLASGATITRHKAS